MPSPLSSTVPWACAIVRHVKECPRCGNFYPHAFQFCPVDGALLLEGPEGDSESSEASLPLPLPLPLPLRKGTYISLKTLVLATAFLVSTSVLAFTGVFFYQYLKPKYGGLVVKTTPSGAAVYVDGKQRGSSPLTIGEIRAGGHQIKAAKEGYREYVQQVEVIPYSTENLHWTLDPIVPHLTNEQLAEIEAWKKKVESAQKENILLPPPDDYNVLYFADRILQIDPANAYAQEVKGKVAEITRRSAEVAYAREEWLEAEKHYKNLALMFPNDISISERLDDIATKIDASLKDREKQIGEWTGKAEAAFNAGTLVPPDKDNALDALRNIERLDKKNAYAREALSRLKELLVSRGDTKISSGDWQGARGDFRLVLQYFPDDTYSKSRLSMVESKLAETALAEQQRIQRTQEEQQSGQRTAALRQSALNSYRSGAHAKAISEWQEYLKFDPGSDEALFYLGASYMEQKQLDTAILYFERCVSVNPNHALAHLNLGILYDRHRNDLAKAAEHLRKVKELGGTDKYSPERVQAMIRDVQERTSLNAVQNETFPVEHRHAFSSCRGGLVITQNGIEFKTTETDHSFYEAYGALRTFSVQGDELSIKTQNNKRYNFHFLKEGDGSKVRRLAGRYTLVTQ